MNVFRSRAELVVGSGFPRPTGFDCVLNAFDLNAATRVEVVGTDGVARGGVAVAVCRHFGYHGRCRFDLRV